MPERLEKPIIVCLVDRSPFVLDKQWLSIIGQDSWVLEASSSLLVFIAVGVAKSGIQPWPLHRPSFVDRRHVVEQENCSWTVSIVHCASNVGLLQAGGCRFDHRSLGEHQPGGPGAGSRLTRHTRARPGDIHKGPGCSAHRRSTIVSASRRTCTTSISSPA